ncbi:MAG: phospho-sugar mutase [Eubacteriales bacterium]|nr:phospho-sugar mutase [Eubacteriales bacterium]
MDVMQSYKKWLENFKDDAALVEELNSIADDPKEIEDRFYQELSFGTAGMRGVMGYGTNRMNDYNVRRATAGFAEFLKSSDPDSSKRGVVIGYDSRINSAEYAKQTALVLCARGIKAYLFESLRPVPVLSYAVRHLNCSAGVAITASHNPKAYNGYKVYGEDGAQLGPEAAALVTKAIQETQYKDAVAMPEDEALEKGLLKYIGEDEVDRDYIDMVLSLQVREGLLKKLGSELSIVYTPLHGSGNVPVRRVLREAGIKNVTVVEEQENPDGNFPTVTAPNPEDPAAFELAIPLAEKVGATVIIGTDPDCDRMGLCVRDGSGVYRTLNGNQIAALLLHHILSSLKKSDKLPKNGAACKSIVSTQLAKSICDAYGVSLFDTLTGFKFIGEKIQEFEDNMSHTFLFGFEESYGYLSSTAVRDKDAVNASLLAAEAACACMEKGITLYEQLINIYEEYGYWAEKTISVTLPGKDGQAKIASIMDNLRKNTPEKIGDYEVLALRDYQTGLRKEGEKQTPLGTTPSNVLYFELQGGHWVCVRPSGTEPKIKLYVNTCAKTQDEAQALYDALLEASKQMLK